PGRRRAGAGPRPEPAAPAQRRSSAAGALLLGACLGVSHLARPVVVPTLPIWLAAAALAAPGGQRLRRCAAVLGGFAPFAVAILLYKWRVPPRPFPRPR